MNHLPALIILFPLSAALLALALSKIHCRLSRAAVLLALTVSLVLSIVQLKKVMAEGTLHYVYGGYAMPYGIEFVIDGVNAILLVMIFLIGVITTISVRQYEGTKDKTLLGGAYTMLALLVVGMAGMTSTGDLFNLYVFLEITSLSGYCLISLGGSRGIVAAFRYLLVGTVAATAYLLGVAILYGATGTLNMVDMAARLNAPGHEDAMLIALCLFLCSFGIKMPMFPFHGWQPSAYTHAEPGVRPLIAGVMGKIPAYAMFRYLYCIFGTDFRYFKHFLIVLGVLSCLAMLYGSLRAMAQQDIRKMLAYSSIAQIGYLTLGFAIGTPYALAGAFLHMIGHAFMKSGLFFCSGAIRYRFGSVSIEEFGRLYRKMPLTAGLLVVAALSMIGIPPTVGFFGKWYLALGAAETHHYAYIAVLVLSSLLNAVYFFKLIEKVFLAKDRGLPDRLAETAAPQRELPVVMLVPIVVCFLAILGLGLFNAEIVSVLLDAVKGVAL